MKLSLAMIIGLVGLVSPSSIDAQSRERGEIPASSRPPAGMCRVWLDNVPAAQQPAPTDCASAVRNRPAKGRVIFGDDYVSARKTKQTDSNSKAQGPATKTGQSIKGFAPSKTTKKPIIKLP